MSGKLTRILLGADSRILCNINEISSKLVPTGILWPIGRTSYDSPSSLQVQQSSAPAIFHLCERSAQGQ